MLIVDSEHEIDPEDINDNGESFFELIDRENSNYMNQVRELEQKLAQLKHVHRNNIEKIWQSFGIKVRTDKKTKLTEKKKRQIRKKIQRWSRQRSY